MTHTATVETLTAQVRVLMVGSRQVTLSVAKQLDAVPPTDIHPMGRIKLSHDMGMGGGTPLDLIGTDTDGNLVRAFIPGSWQRGSSEPHRHVYEAATRLPLIVLAGLK